MSSIHTKLSQNSLVLLKTLLILSILSLSSTNSVCPSSAYVSASDASSYASAICGTVAANTKYRIQGGASLSCSAGSPSLTSSDPDILAQALCITITTTPGGSSSSTSDIPIKRTQPPGCPADYIQATYSQALTYKTEICSALGQWDIVALQGGGSIRGPGYGCAVTQTETTSMGDIACVPLSYIGPVTTATIAIVNADEDICSSCQSLITTAEASTYYTSIPVGTTAQIAGGSSIQRTSTSTFAIIDHDTTSRSSQICAPNPRAGCPTSSYLTSSCTCQACVSSCSTCSGSADYCTSCNSASSSKYLYHGVCYATCPPGTYAASPSTCEGCASPCQTCSSTSTTCTTCLSNFPYFLNDYCYHTCPDGFYNDPISKTCLRSNPTVATESKLPKITRIFSKTSNIGFTVGAAFSSGPMAIFTGLLFKLIGYIKYLDIAYPNNLEKAFQKWQLDIIPSIFPEMSQTTKNKLEAKSIPSIYLGRKLTPTFLENFWFSMLNLALSFFSLGCVFLAAIYCKRKGKKNAELILKYLLIGLVNFIIVQLYYHCGDILLFFILETRSIDFGSAVSIISLSISIVFLSVAICTLALHSFILLRERDAHKTKKISEFEQKYSLFKILFGAFKSSSFLSSSFLLLFTLRDVALNLIIALLFEHTLAQAILFICICVAFMSYLIIMRPFKRTLENIGLCFFEALVLLTYIAALLIRCADQEKTKKSLGMVVIVMAFVFSVVATILMIFSLLRMGLHFYKQQAQRKAIKKIHILPENSQTIQQNIHITNRADLRKNSTFLETNDSTRALDASPGRSIRGFGKNETVPAHNTVQTELSLSNNLSLAEQRQIKRSQGSFSARREKNRLELFNNSPPDKFEKLQPDKSVIQEESDQTSRSVSPVKFDKRESSRLYTNQSHLSNLSNHPNSVNLISYTKLPSNADSPESKFSRFNHNFKDSALTDSRIINFSPEKERPTAENHKNQL